MPGYIGLNGALLLPKWPALVLFDRIYFLSYRSRLSGKYVDGSRLVRNLNPVKEFLLESVSISVWVSVTRMMLTFLLYNAIARETPVRLVDAAWTGTPRISEVICTRTRSCRKYVD